MAGRSYYKSVSVYRIKKVFPFAKKPEYNRKGSKLILALLSGITAPITLFGDCAQNTVPYVELVVTQKCNLNCKGCANLMPLYSRNAKHFSLEELKNSVDELLSVSKHVGQLKLIGGEPFLYPNMAEIIEYILQKPQIKSIIITTNGSVKLSENVLKALRNPKISVEISDYPMIDSGRFIEALKKAGVIYKLLKFEAWKDYGGVEKRNLSREDLRRSFASCAASECKTILNGKMYTCPRAAHGAVTGKIPCPDNNRYDLKRKNAREMKALYSLPYAEVCDYCTPVWARNDIECGVQEERT